MQATRRARLEAVIIEELSMVVPRELKDPRIPPITFTSVELTEDAGMAIVKVSLLGSGTPAGADPTGKKMKDAIQGLESAKGFLRRHLAKVLTIRTVPELSFREDRGFENTMRVHELLKQLESSSSAAGAGGEDDDADELE